MKSLLLSGFGININVNGRKLIVYKRQNNEKIEFYPHQIPYDNVIIDGYYGNISFEALRWLSKHGITLSLLNWNGNLLSVTLPSGPISGRLKIKQYVTYGDKVKRYEIASKIIETKINKSKELLIMLSDYYKELYKPEIIKLFNKEIETFQNLQKDNVIGRKITLLNPRSLKNNVDFKKILENNAILNKNSKNLDKINENFEKDIEIKKSNRDSQKVIVPNSNNSANIKENINFLMMCEGRIADYYWKMLSKVFNKLYPDFNFKQRKNLSYSQGMNASDYVNALLNYGYAILESVIRKTINIIGLDPNIGFLHEINPSKQPLVYDLQELYRWLIDLSVIQVLEDKRLKKSDFIVTENYHIRLRESAARKLLEKITLNFNKRTEFRGKLHTYDNILLENVRNLAKYIENNERTLEFDIPKVEISRNDTNEIRNDIMSITTKERKRLEINKSTLWYRQKAIKEGKKIKLYNK